MACEASRGPTVKGAAEPEEEPKPGEIELLEPDPTPWRAPEAVDGGTLHITTWSKIDGALNRLTAFDAGVEDLYDTFVGGRVAQRHVDDPERWRGDLAERVTASADRRSYRIALKRGVLWHPPPIEPGPRHAWIGAERREVTADDFLFAVEVARSPAGRPGEAAIFQDLEAIAAPDPYTLELKWRRPSVIAEAAALSLAPAPRWLLGRDEDGVPIGLEGLEGHWSRAMLVGTGPFRQHLMTPGHALELVRDERWHGGRAPLDGVVIHLGPLDARLQMWREGALDAMALAPSQIAQAGGDLGALLGAEGWRSVEVTRQAWRFVGWNNRGAFFSDPRVRRAMTLGIDRERLLNEAQAGQGEVATGPLPPGSRWVDPEIQPLPFDLAAARALLDEAGWIDTDGDGLRDREIAGQRVTLAFQLLHADASAEEALLARQIQHDLALLGVRAVPSPASWTDLRRLLSEGDFDAYVGGWALGWEADPLPVWHSSQIGAPTGANALGFSDPEADRLLTEARTRFDPDERQDLLRRFHRLVHEAQPATFLLNPRAQIALRPRVQNLRVQRPRPHLLYDRVWLTP